MAEDRGGILHLGRGEATVDTDRVRVRQELSMFPCTIIALLSWWEKKLGWARFDTTIAPFFAKNRTKCGKELKYCWDLRISQVPPGGEGRHNLGEVPFV